MSAKALKLGALGGVLGGAVMAIWTMIVFWLTGVGFWTPLNLIAHTVWRSAPLDATFSWGGPLLGMAVHLAMSILLGVVLAALVSATPGLARKPGATGIIGMVYGLGVWLVMQYALWPALDDAAADRFTPWVFAVGHVIYGLHLGVCLAGVGSRSTRQPVR